MGNTHDRHHLDIPENHTKSKHSSLNSSPLSHHRRLSSKSNHSNYEQQLDSQTVDQTEGEILAGLPNHMFPNSKPLETFKILLCGSGSTGKTTFLKSIELYKKGFANMQNSFKKGIIYFNMIRDIGVLSSQYLSAATEFLNFKLLNGLKDGSGVENDGCDEQIESEMKFLSEMFPGSDLPLEITNSMERLIKISNSRSFLHSSASRSSCKQYNATFDTFFNEQTFEDIELLWRYRPFNLFAHFHLTHSNIPEFLTPVNTILTDKSGENDYEKFMLSLRNNDFDDLIYFLDSRLNELYPPYQYDPSYVDLLHRRQKTVGFYHLNYVQDVIPDPKSSEAADDGDGLDGMRETRNYIFVDTGGQRSERKKWAMCYPHAFSVFYFVSLADINLTLYESNVENRMLDSLHLFEQVCKEPDLVQTPLVLFFTKPDLLRRKIQNGFKPIEFFEKIEKLYLKENKENGSGQTVTTTTVNTVVKGEEVSILSDSNQVEIELNHFIEFITEKFKQKLLPTQTLTIYTLDSTDENLFKTTFNTIITALNKTLKD